MQQTSANLLLYC